MTIHLFNPETDMALAERNAHYMPPESIRSMARDLAMLPVWYADPGHAVLALSDTNCDYLRRLHSYFSLPVELVSPQMLQTGEDARIQPWGWNHALRNRLQEQGVSSRRLPAVEWLDNYRELSGRQSCIGILQSFQDMEGCCGTMARMESVEDCRIYAAACSQGVVFKTPWSSSGKGLRWCRKRFGSEDESWCARSIRKQGYLVASPIVDRVCDLAMEFYSDGRGKVVFAGYSLFDCDAKGRYTGNLLAAQEYIERLLIASYFPLPFLVRVREQLCRQLALTYAKSYSGYLGVDMMVVKDGTSGRYLLHPCSEVNLRMNMGVVARLFTERYLVKDRVAFLHLAHAPLAEELYRVHLFLSDRYPLKIYDGRVMDGYLPLVPLTSQSRSMAFVLTIPRREKKL
ncbi:MAG: hypothetical protein ACI37U_01655 [Bacteroides sp.]